jgi:pimeloyl-ACP methyl ester carboxylesterase
MSDFLLIHGSCHGAWCWTHVIAALAKLGHRARAIDLPAHGQDLTPVAQATLDSYAGAILAAIDRPVILVGHSMAGYPITLAADRAPEKIDRLVYLCAYLPVPGLSLADMRRAGPRQPLAPAIRVDPDRTSFTFDPAMTPDLFYHDCPSADRALAATHLCAEPLLPQETPFHPTRTPHPRRAYIRCTEDRAIPPEYQLTMAASLPADQISTLPASHSPFFADPVALAARLDAIART